MSLPFSCGRNPRERRESAKCTSEGGEGQIPRAGLLLHGSRHCHLSLANSHAGDLEISRYLVQLGI